MAVEQKGGLTLVGFFIAAIVAVMLAKFLVSNTSWAGEWV